MVFHDVETVAQALVWNELQVFCRTGGPQSSRRLCENPDLGFRSAHLECVALICRWGLGRLWLASSGQSSIMNTPLLLLCSTDRLAVRLRGNAVGVCVWFRN